MSYLQPYPSKIRSSLCRVPGIGVLELHCEVGPAKHQKMTELARPSICWMFNVFVNLHQIDLKIVELAQMTPLSSHHIGPHCHSIFDTSFSPIHLPMKHLETSSIWQHTIILAKLTKLELQANTSAPVTWKLHNVRTGILRFVCHFRKWSSPLLGAPTTQECAKQDQVQKPCRESHRVQF